MHHDDGGLAEGGRHTQAIRVFYASRAQWNDGIKARALCIKQELMRRQRGRNNGMKVTIIISRLPGGAHRARCPALPGCLVDAASREMAAQRVRSAVNSYLSSLDSAAPETIEIVIADEPSAAGVAAPARSRMESR